MWGLVHLRMWPRIVPVRIHSSVQNSFHYSTLKESDFVDALIHLPEASIVAVALPAPNLPSSSLHGRQPRPQVLTVAQNGTSRSVELWR